MIRHRLLPLVLVVFMGWHLLVYHLSLGHTDDDDFPGGDTMDYKVLFSTSAKRVYYWSTRLKVSWYSSLFSTVPSQGYYDSNYTTSYHAFHDSLYENSSQFSWDAWLEVLAEEYPNCTGPYFWIADGYCDRETNNPSCGYDGGDCCRCNCNYNISTDQYSLSQCAYGGTDCIDPSALNTTCAPETASSYSVGYDGYQYQYESTSERLDALAREYPDCEGYVINIGDGYCDAKENVPSCGYDGGDCCPCTCVSTAMFFCGYAGYNCVDPRATTLENLCSPPVADVPPCAAHLPKQWTVNDSEGASSLAQAIYCSGGIFEVEWIGSVVVNHTIFVLHDTVLQVNGGKSSNANANADVNADAIANGGGVTRIFTVINASLNVVGMQFVNGSAPIGGAIAAEQSRVTIRRASFLESRASYGGALFARDESYVEWLEDTVFSGNTAELSGGAIFVSNASHVSWSGRTNFTGNSARNAGGGLHVRGSSNVTWEGQTVFADNNASFGGAVSLQHSPRVDFTGNVVFVGNIAQIGSGGGMYIGSGCNVTISGESNFIGNRAIASGGAIDISESDSGSVDSTLSIHGNASFTGNACRGSGGGIASEGGLKIDFETSQLKFSGNMANISGGALYLSGAAVGYKLKDAVFTGNTAGEHGGAVYTTATASLLRSMNPTIFKRCEFLGNRAQGTGGAIHTAFGIYLVKRCNFVGNVAGSGGALRFAAQQARVKKCSFRENSCSPGQGAAVSNVGLPLEVSASDFEGNYFQCGNDEYVDSIEVEGADRYAEVCADCQDCAYDCYVAESEKLPTCTRAPKHTSSSGGSISIKTLAVDQGFWRTTDLSTNILPCYNPEACVGGLTDSPHFCGSKYEGPYCTVCREGFASRVQHACVECAQEAGGMVLIIVLTVFLSLVILLLLWYMACAKAEVVENELMHRIAKRLPLQSIKIVIVVWQIVTQFASAANVTYPEAYQRLLNIVKILNFELEWFLSAACILDVDFHFRFVMIIVGPAIALALLGVTYVIAAARNRHSQAALQRVQYKHMTAVLWLTFLVYSSTSSAVFRMFACDKLEDGHGYHAEYLMTDYRLQCTSWEHRALQILAGIMILVYPVGIPVFYAVMLFRKRTLLEDQDRREEDVELRPISALWKPYKPERFYYEVIECVRRMWLAGAVAFISPNTAAQIAVIIVIALVFAFLCEGLTPYVSRVDTWVSRAGHAIVFLSMYLALLAKVDVSDERHRSQHIYAGVLIGAHVCMVAAIVVEAIVLICWAKAPLDEVPRFRSPRSDLEYNDDDPNANVGVRSFSLRSRKSSAVKDRDCLQSPVL